MSNIAIFAALALCLFVARASAHGIQRIGLPSVIGELLVGIVLGALPVFGTEFQHHPAILLLVEFGSLILLFEVGLGTSFAELRQVGVSAGKVAIAGVMFSLILGLGVSHALGASSTLIGQTFIGAALAATSVGVTARVLRDLKMEHSVEAKIIIAAAVFDDVIGLILLAFVAALVQSANGGSVNILSILALGAKSALFIGLGLALGKWVVPRLFIYSAKYLGKGSQLITALSMCLSFSSLAHVFGLAPIIGAFMAGLIIHPKDLDVFIRTAAERQLGDQLESISTIFVPLFFVFTGMQVDLSVFADVKLFALGFLLTIAAIIGKVASGWTAGKNVNHLAIGVGMTPRGEVGIIVASMGASMTVMGQPIFSPVVYGAIIMMITITSIVSPVWLGFLLGRKRQVQV